MEIERLYEVTIEEYCDAKFSGSCKIAIVNVKAQSANAACDKALEKVGKEIKLDGLFASRVKCIDKLIL